MEEHLPSNSKNRRPILPLGLAILLALTIIAWAWARYPVIKANWPEIKSKWERAKAIWNDKINVLDTYIKPEFHGLRLFMARGEVYQAVGKENTRELTTEIPEVTGILIEDSLYASDFGYDAWDENGNGIKWKTTFLGLSDYNGKYSKDNPWIKKVNSEMSASGQKIIRSVSCYFFGDIFYKMRIDYEWGYSTEVSWEQFLEPSARAYGWKSIGPNDSYPDVVAANDGMTSLTFMKTYHPESDPMYGDTYVYSVIYEDIKINEDVNRTHGSHFPRAKF